MIRSFRVAVGSRRLTSSPTFRPPTPAQRRGQRDMAGVDTHHFGQHDHIDVGFVGLQVEHRHPGPNPTLSVGASVLASWPSWLSR